MHKKTLFTILILVLVSGVLMAQPKPKSVPMSFDNPGNRRILKTETSNHYYYRSLPEKSMTLNVTGINEITLKSFAIEPLRKPQVTVTVNGKKSTYDLELDYRLNGYYMYKPLPINLPEGATSLDVLCYQRSIYFRSFYTFTPIVKQKIAKVPNLQIKEHAGIMGISHNNTNSEYHSFTKEQAFVFDLNNSRKASVFVRARLMDRTLPVFDLYKDGVKIQSYEFTLKRSTKYKTNGIKHLSVGIKIDLQDNSGSSRYELRAASDHLFLARPVVLKQKRN